MRGSTSASWRPSRPSSPRAARSQVGTGERSEKIRTYNFPQDRVTDHRVKLTKGEVQRILAGELDDFTAALEAEEKRRELEAAAAAGAAETAIRRARSRPAADRSRDALDAAVDALEAAGCDTPRLDAEVLIADALGVDRGRAGRRDPSAGRAARGRRA